MNLCILDLAELTGGRLRLAAMPPREGELAAVERICLAADEARPGDVFWCLAGGGCDFDLAFLRGALGVVGSRQIEPWPGRFSLAVDNPALALERLFAGLLRRSELLTPASGEESLPESPELKTLQLPGQGAIAIFPPTCGQSAGGPGARRCRRTAA
jgi:hypothetical protein